MIRPMEDDDVPAVERLLKTIPGMWHAAWTSQTIQRAYVAANGLARVADIDCEVVGAVFCFDCGFRAYLGGFAVAEQHRKTGVGTALLLHLEELLSRRGSELIIADVWRSAEPFFIKQGWQPPDATLLRKRLTPDRR